jgi:arylsulfatase A-like enzyme
MPNRPNILLFIADGMQARPLAADHPCITPNVERLAGRGILFSRAYTILPTCSPARASLMTGLLPHNHGVWTVEHTVDEDQCVLRDRPHWAQRLVAAGYRTAYFGKWHIERSYDLPRFGWQHNRCTRTEEARYIKHSVADDERARLDPSLSKWLKGPEGYNDMLHYGVTDLPVASREVSVPAGEAIEYLESTAGAAEPWCCCVSYPSPNEAMVASRETFDLYDPAKLDLPANRDDTMADKPAVYRRCRDIWKDHTADDWRIALACYYARITEMDMQLGRLLEFLGRTGQLANTIVIVTSDHGKYVGAHGMDAHNFGAFEEIYNIPLIVAGPGIVAGATTDARVGIHDLCPTILDLAGLEPISGLDARTFAPVLTSPADTGDFQAGYAEYWGNRLYLTQRVYWEGPWKYVFNGFDYDELYNLADDPHELHNLACRPEHRDRVKSMMAAIWQRARATGDKTLQGVHYHPLRLPPVGPNVAKG